MLVARLKRVECLVALVVLVIHALLVVFLAPKALLIIHTSLIPPLLLLFTTSRFFESFEVKSRKLVLQNLLRAGRGIASKYLKLLRFLLELFISLLLLVVCHVVVLLAMPSTVSFAHILLVSVLAVLAVLAYLAPSLLITLQASQRKVGVEVELPYLLILLRALASLRLPIYDVLSIVEGSTAMRSFAREVEFARKIATVKHVSLVSALEQTCSQHPSEKVRELVRRVFAAAISISDVRDVVERVFDDIYSWFEARVSRLTERFTLIIGSALFAYLFIPIIIVTISPVVPVVGASVLAIAGFTLSIQVLVFFVLYALISSFYPSSLVVKPPRKLYALTAVSLATSLLLVAFTISSQLVAFQGSRHSSVFHALVQLLSIDHLLLALAVLSIPPLILAERTLRRVWLYDSFVRLASDAMSIAAATGENLALLLDAQARKRGGRLLRLTRNIIVSYTSDKLRRAVVQSAPSMYHASFIEILTTILRLGYTPDSLRSVSASYEKLSSLVSSVRGFAVMLELLLVGLVAIVGGFLSFVNRVYEQLASIIGSQQAPIRIGAFFVYNPALASLLDILSVLSLLLTALLIGKVRGGSLAYYHRTLVLVLLVYYLSRLLLH